MKLFWCKKNIWNHHIDFFHNVQTPQTFQRPHVPQPQFRGRCMGMGTGKNKQLVPIAQSLSSFSPLDTDFSFFLTAGTESITPPSSTILLASRFPHSLRNSLDQNMAPIISNQEEATLRIKPIPRRGYYAWNAVWIPNLKWFLHLPSSHKNNCGCWYKDEWEQLSELHTSFLLICFIQNQGVQTSVPSWTGTRN